jgi:4-amino-4-deoxy-L-arabinose transferase-like glycosyltransferase
MTTTERVLVALAVVVATANLAAFLGTTALWPPNETRVAEISREMAESGELTVPRLNGEPFLEEPPLFYWLQAGLYRAMAPSAIAARIPAAVAAMLGVGVAIGLARTVGTSAGVAALVVATAPEYWWMARSGTPDTANATATALALLAFYAAWRSGGRTALALAAAAAACAFWLKSLLGVGLAVATAGAFVVSAGRGRLGIPALAAAASGIAAAGALWLLLLGGAEGGGAVSFFLVTNHLGRLLGQRDQGHLRPVFYYLRNLPLDLLPWSLALPAAVAAAWSQRAEPARRFALVWATVMTVGLTLSAAKSAHYLLPAYPAFAALIACWWWKPPSTRLDRLTWACLGAVLLVVIPAVTFVLAGLDAGEAFAALDRDPGGRAVAATLLDGRPGALGWCAVAAVATAGALFVAAHRAGRPGLAAVAATSAALVVQLVVAGVTLPRFDVFCSAQPLGEALGQAARDGVDVFTWGFDNRERVSPYSFYAGRSLPTVHGVREVRERLAGGRACALVPADAWAPVQRGLPALAVTEQTVGRLRLALVTGSTGGCPGTLEYGSGGRNGWARGS